MSEAAVEEVSVLSSIYCAEGEFELVQDSVEDGLMVQISSTVGGRPVRLLFQLSPGYPSRPPAVSVSSTTLSRSQCHSIRQKIVDRAAALPPEPMVHQLVEWMQQECVETTDACGGGDEEETEKEEEWTAVLSLDHIRSENRYVSLLERWSRQQQLSGSLLLGRRILVVLKGARPNIKEFCRLLKTVKVDVDSSGKKCKERMMKVLIERRSSSSHGPGLQGFVVKTCETLPELTAAFQELNMTDVFQQILPSLKD